MDLSNIASKPVDRRPWPVHRCHSVKSKNCNLEKWEGEGDSQCWVKKTVIEPIESHKTAVSQANLYPPLPLFLKDGHYATVFPGPGPFPMSWHDQPRQSTCDAGDLRGGTKSVKSYRSWLPASSKESTKKSYKSWLPASSSGSVKNASAHKTTSAKNSGRKGQVTASVRNPAIKSGRRQVSADHKKSWLPATSKSVASSIADPLDHDDPPAPVPKNKKKALGKGKTFDPSRYTEWSCPVCATCFKGTYTSVIGRKNYHWQTRHSDMPKDMVCRPKPVVISVAYNLPDDERAWSCPLCPAALPSLSLWDNQKAIRKHIKDEHPDETLQFLYDRRRKSFLKPGVRAHNHEKYAKAKQRKHKTHTIVTVEAVERDARGRDNPNKGRTYYCTTCLGKIGRNPEAAKTCAARRRDFRKKCAHSVHAPEVVGSIEAERANSCQEVCIGNEQILCRT